jgi:hypothetical protein
MDPAMENSIQMAIEHQGAMLGRHEEDLSTTRHAVESLAARMTDLSEQIHHLRLDPPPRPQDVHEPRVNNPPCYAGEPSECRSFLTQCEVVFSLQPVTYSQDRARIAYIVSLLTGRAREWGTAVWNAESDCLDRYSLFKEEMTRVFDRSAHGTEASRLLSSLRQGRRSVPDYAIEFRTLATSCGWNEPAQVARFLEGLNADIKDEVISRELPTRLDALIDLAIRIDKRFELRRRSRSMESTLLSPLPATTISSSACAGTEPMQLGGIRITAAERERRICNRLCLYCGSAGHYVSTCQLKANARQ